MDKQDQMFFDGQHNGYDSFLGEVIQILRPNVIHIDIANHGERSIDRKVRIEFAGDDIAQEQSFKTVQYGRSYGEALRKVREQIRVECGQ